jgi:hypothetical protein
MLKVVDCYSESGLEKFQCEETRESDLTNRSNRQEAMEIKEEMAK